VRVTRRNAGSSPQDLSRCTNSASQRAADRGGFSVRVASFSGEKQRGLHRPRERAPGARSLRKDVAVGAARKRIALPVVPQDALEQRGIVPPTKQRAQASVHAGDDLTFALASQLLGPGTGAPRDEERASHRK